MCVHSANLNIVRQLHDHVAEGRACGNLGNTHYLLGNFSLAISFHQEVVTLLHTVADDNLGRSLNHAACKTHLALRNISYPVQ